MAGTKVELPRNPVAPGSRWTSAMSVWSLPLQTLSAISQMLTMLTQKSLAGLVCSSRTVAPSCGASSNIHRTTCGCRAGISPLLVVSSHGGDDVTGRLVEVAGNRDSSSHQAERPMGTRRASGRLRALTTISAPCSNSRRQPASPSRGSLTCTVRVDTRLEAPYVAAYGVRVTAAPARE